MSFYMNTQACSYNNCCKVELCNYKVPGRILLKSMRLVRAISFFHSRVNEVQYKEQVLDRTGFVAEPHAFRGEADFL